MVINLNKISIKKQSQFYLLKIIKKYPGINSGRKNYKTQYIRVLKNILMSKAYNVLSKSKKLDHFGNYKFEEKFWSRRDVECKKKDGWRQAKINNFSKTNPVGEYLHVNILEK